LALLLVHMIIIGLTSLMLVLSEDTLTLNEYTERIIDYENIYSIARDGEVFLQDIFIQDDPKIDYLGEPWSKEMVIPIALGSVKILIVDQERFININNLVRDNDKVDKKYLAIVDRLFRLLEINTVLIYNIIDWIDKNKTSDGGEEIYKDYLAKNSYLDTPEELLLIKGITPKIFYGDEKEKKFGLKDFITTYSNGKININTAPKYVLMALDENIDGTTADGIISSRKGKPFKKIEELVERGLIDNKTYTNIRNIIDVKSQNFIVYFDITIGNREYKIEMLVERKDKKIKKIWLKVI